MWIMIINHDSKTCIQNPWNSWPSWLFGPFFISGGQAESLRDEVKKRERELREEAGSRAADVRIFVLYELKKGYIIVY